MPNPRKLGIIMEMCECNLKHYIQARNMKSISKILKQLIEGFQKLQRKLVVHSDIKPQNILINREGNIKIIDFGKALK
jgi:serine/threonine protein kinase